MDSADAVSVTRSPLSDKAKSRRQVVFALICTTTSGKTQPRELLQEELRTVVLPQILEELYAHGKKKVSVEFLHWAIDYQLAEHYYAVDNAVDRFRETFLPGFPQPHIDEPPFSPDYKAYRDERKANKAETKATAATAASVTDAAPTANEQIVHLPDIRDPGRGKLPGHFWESLEFGPIENLEKLRTEPWVSGRFSLKIRLPAATLSELFGKMKMSHKGDTAFPWGEHTSAVCLYTSRFNSKYTFRLGWNMSTSVASRAQDPHVQHELFQAWGHLLGWWFDMRNGIDCSFSDWINSYRSIPDQRKRCIDAAAVMRQMLKQDLRAFYAHAYKVFDDRESKHGHFSGELVYGTQTMAKRIETGAWWPLEPRHLDAARHEHIAWHKSVRWMLEGTKVLAMVKNMTHQLYKARGITVEILDEVVQEILDRTCGPVWKVNSPPTSVARAAKEIEAWVQSDSPDLLELKVLIGCLEVSKLAYLRWYQMACQDRDEIAKLFVQGVLPPLAQKFVEKNLAVEVISADVIRGWLYLNNEQCLGTFADRATALFEAWRNWPDLSEASRTECDGWAASLGEPWSLK
ncbi:hypothetical protein QBC44DRAFT_385915 [Cladorrhinum sp. PSN332]|nr:hypothetical protein QBC44DRAFT_385915 [Cladorrhinum sp. PSN332]